MLLTPSEVHHKARATHQIPVAAGIFCCPRPPVPAASGRKAHYSTKPRQYGGAVAFNVLINNGLLQLLAERIRLQYPACSSKTAAVTH